MRVICVFRTVSLFSALLVGSCECAVKQVAKLLASDGSTGDDFGVAVALSADGTTAVVGAQYSTVTGAAYVYRLTEAGWAEQVKLIPTDTVDAIQFGMSVAINGDGTLIVIGAWDDQGGVEAGSAYVYSFGATNGWTQVAKLLANDAAPGDRFGQALAVSANGDKIVATAYWDDDGGTQSGSAYVFSRNLNNLWIQDAKLVPSSHAPEDRFGWSVAIDSIGEHIFVGSPRFFSPGGNFGSVTVFNLSATGWVEVASLQASDAASGDEFGSSVATSRDATSVIVGASGANSYSGASYVFNLVDGAWVEQDKLVGHTEGERFGYSVSMSLDGKRGCIGSFGANARSGTGFLYEESIEGTWVLEASFAPSDVGPEDMFGHRVWMSADGTRAVINARGDDDAGSNAGSVYVWALDSTTTPTLTPTQVLTTTPTLTPTQVPTATSHRKRMWRWECDCDLAGGMTLEECRQECRNVRGRWGWTCESGAPGILPIESTDPLWNALKTTCT